MGNFAEVRHLALHTDFSVLFGLCLVFRFFTAPETTTTNTGSAEHGEASMGSGARVHGGPWRGVL